MIEFIFGLLALLSFVIVGLAIIGFILSGNKGNSESNKSNSINPVSNTTNLYKEISRPKEPIIKTQDNLDNENFPKEINTKIAGVTFENRQPIVRRLAVGEVVKLVREPNNQYDKNAIAVYNENSEKLGYVPKDDNKNLAKAMDSGIEYASSVTRKNGGNGLSYGANIQIKKISTKSHANNVIKVECPFTLSDENNKDTYEIYKGIEKILGYVSDAERYQEICITRESFANQNHLIFLRKSYHNEGTYNQFINNIKNTLKAYYSPDKITYIWDMQLRKELLKYGIDNDDVSIITALSVVLLKKGLTNFNDFDSNLDFMYIVSNLPLPGDA